MNTFRTPIQIYALSVCFMAILCFIITLGIALYDIVQIVNPEFTYSPPEFIVSPIPKPGTSEYQEALETEKNRASRSLVQTSIILVIDLGVFYFHWKIANSYGYQSPGRE